MTLQARPSASEPQDHDLSSTLHRWGHEYRVALAGVGLLVSLLVLREVWVWGAVSFYLAFSAAVAIRARTMSDAERARWAPVWLFADVALVGTLSYAWGTATSPLTWMFVPLVLGWTVAPVERLGRAALSTVLLTTASLLTFEQLGWIPSAPGLVPAPLAPSLAVRVGFFSLFALALIASHLLVDLVVRQWREHAALAARLEAERQLQARDRQLASQLEEAQRLEALGRLAGGIAHDFNNQLAALTGLAELALEKLASGNAGAAPPLLQEMLRHATRSEALTTQLLDFARRRPSEPEPTDVAQLIQRSSKLLERVLDGRAQLRITGLQESGCVVEIDPGELERAVVNLVANARDAMSQPGVVEVEVSRDDAQVCLEVRDDGQGIASADLTRIFEPFFSRKPMGTGTGLGLSSVHGIVRRSGGSIDVQSASRIGTSFSLHWPAAAPPAAALGATTAAGASEPPASTTRKVVEPSGPNTNAVDDDGASAPACAGPILVVDDDEAVRMVARAQLEAAGYPVTMAANARDAMALLDQSTDAYRLLITDVVMPGTSGVELAEYFAQKSPNTPVLLMSGYADDVLSDKQRNWTLLHKPFTSEHMLSTVRAALDRTPAPTEDSNGKTGREHG